MQLSQARLNYLRWLEVARNPSQHTLRAYASDLKVLERHVDMATVETLTTDNIFRFIEAQRHLGLSISTIKRRASAVRGLCSWLCEQELVDSNPWDGLRLHLRRTRTLPRPVPHDDLRALLVHLCREAGLHDLQTAVLPDDRTVEATTLVTVALMVTTGIRVGEAVSIKNADVDLDGRQIRIHGKGARERQVYLSNDWVTSLVERYRRVRSLAYVQHDQLLFNRGRGRLTAAAVRSRLATASLQAGLSRRVTPHMLRHTAATELIVAGVDIRYVQRLLGHSSLTTTEIYTHVADHALRRVITNADVLGRALDIESPDPPMVRRSA